MAGVQAEEQLKAVAVLLDVEPAEVVDAVEGLLAFNDQSNARIIRGELDERDAAAEAHAMAAALLADIEAAAQMFQGEAGSGDLLLLLATLRSRVALRLSDVTGGIKA